MGRTGSLFIVLISNILVQGIIIDPRRAGSSSEVHVHCVTSGEVIQIKDPFIASKIHDEKFIAMEWYRYLANRTNETMLLQFVTNKPVKLKLAPKITVYEFWGLQINSVDITDSGEYKAIYMHLSHTNESWVQIVVARPPVLASEKLSIYRKVNGNDKSVTVSCGQINDRGSPPINILLKMENGTVLPTVYSNGSVEVEISSREGIIWR